MCLPVYVRDVRNCKCTKIVKNPQEFSLSKFCFIIKHFQAGVIKHKQNFKNQGLCNALVVDEYLVCFGFLQQGMWCWKAHL